MLRNLRPTALKEALSLTDMGYTVISKSGGGGELFSVPQREDECGTLVRAQHHCVFLQRQNGVTRLRARERSGGVDGFLHGSSDQKRPRIGKRSNYGTQKLAPARPARTDRRGGEEGSGEGCGKGGRSGWPRWPCTQTVGIRLLIQHSQKWVELT